MEDALADALTLFGEKELRSTYHLQSILRARHTDSTRALLFSISSFLDLPNNRGYGHMCRRTNIQPKRSRSPKLISPGTNLHFLTRLYRRANHQSSAEKYPYPFEEHAASSDRDPPLRSPSKRNSREDLPATDLIQTRRYFNGSPCPRR